MRWRILLAVAAIPAAVLLALSGGASARGRAGVGAAAGADVTNIAIPGPKVVLPTQLRVGRRYKLIFRGTGSSKQGVAPDFDWFYCFQATCGLGVGNKVVVAYFCNSEPSNFGETTPGKYIAYRPDHTYQLTVERTFDTPLPSGITDPGKFVFRNAAGDIIGGCQRGESEPGTLEIDPSFAKSTLLTYVEGGQVKLGPGGTFQIEMTDVGAIARPPTTSTPASPQSPQAPSGSSAPASSLNTAVVGHRYSAGASGQKVVTTGGRFTSTVGTYVAQSASVRLTTKFTYTSSRQGASVTGTAVVTLLLRKQSGSGADQGSLPLTYKIVSAAKSTPDKAAREWQLGGRLVKPNVTGCKARLIPRRQAQTELPRLQRLRGERVHPTRDRLD